MIDFARYNEQSPLSAALSYAFDLRIAVFPASPDKRPLVHWSSEATTDPGKIRFWWSQWPEACVALAMGNGWHALDLDRKKDGDGWSSYLAAGGPRRPSWPVQRTPSGGLHLLWRTEPAMGFRNFTRAGLFGGLDMRTDGGYILAAPSPGYTWGDGDPEAPIPETLLNLCRAASRRSRERAEGEIPMPAPAALTEAQAREKIEALGARYAGFLLREEPITGDASRDAYICAHWAFLWGAWSLEEMAAIGPRTTLGAFGAASPHNAPDPWAWCWRYTITSAWKDSGRVQTEKESPAGGAGPSPSQKKEEGSATATNENEHQDSTYDLLRLRAQSLPVRDFPATRTWLKLLIASGVGSGEAEALLHEAKIATEYSLKHLRDALGELRAEGKTSTRAGKEELHEVYVRDQGRLIDRGSHRMISVQAFLDLRAREHGGDLARTRELWIHGSGALCEGVESLQYDPGLPHGVVRDDDGVRVYNLYRPSGLRPSQGSVDPWLALLERLDVEEGREEMLDWLAWLVQRPGVKVNHALLLGGDKGIGKDSFLAPVLAAVGRANVTTISGEELSGNFNDFIGRTKLLVVNEVDYGGRRGGRDISERLKPMLASPPERLRVNEKNLRPYEIPNRLQGVLMTNHRLPLHIEPGERRYLAVWCAAPGPRSREMVEESARWFTDYWAWLKSGGESAVLGWLLARDLSTFRPGAKPLDTIWLEEMTRNSASPLEAWLLDGALSGEGIWAQETVSPQEVMGLLLCDAEGIGGLGDGARVTLRTVEEAMMNLAFRRVGRTLRFRMPEGVGHLGACARVRGGIILPWEATGGLEGRGVAGRG